MSRDLMDENYYVSHGGLIPVKWTAPEVLHNNVNATAYSGILIFFKREKKVVQFSHFSSI